MVMIVAIHQPNYIPWIGYFHKIYNSDIFVFLDDVQYPKGQLVNRNKIRTAAGETYLNVPVLTKGFSKQLINEVQIDNHVNWRKKHWKSIFYNYNKAQYFDSFSPFFKELYKKEWEKLCELNEYIIKNITEMMGIETSFIRSTELDIEGKSTERLVNIVMAVGGDTYLSGTGAKSYTDENMFQENGLNLKYQDFHHPYYNQLFGAFIPKMSIIDMLFNEGKKSLDLIRGA
ncbi:MAG: WbqC family protein [Thermoplasmata archaeon]|nr:MAG: WbqC family protein [Thermoplasmata archaeon]